MTVNERVARLVDCQETVLHDEEASNFNIRPEVRKVRPSLSWKPALDDRNSPSLFDLVGRALGS